MTTNPSVHARLLGPRHRVHYTAQLFGHHFPFKLEPTVFAMAGKLSGDYSGGYWHFYALGNGGFYMAPSADTLFKVQAENSFEGQLTGDSLGVTSCLYAFSALSFGRDGFAEVCAEQFHRLRAFAVEHPDWAGIAAAVD